MVVPRGAAAFEDGLCGGGTPSVLPPELWERLLEAVHRYGVLLPPEEFTVEANPESLSSEHLALWKDGGVSRISLGVQSFKEHHLKRLGRPYSPDRARNVAERVLEAGFDLTLDFMFGLPEQTLEEWRDDLKEACNLGAEHISLYHLSLEEGTPWGEHPPENLPEGYRFYRWAQYYLPRHGLEQYEVASFALPGKEARHNLAYWRQHNVVGVGAGAWGYLEGERYGHVRSVEEYMAAWEDPDDLGAFEKSLGYRECLPPEDRAAESAVLLLRTKWGIPLKSFRRAHGARALGEICARLRPYMPEFVVHSAGHLRFTPRGMRVANQIWSDLV